MNRDLVEETLRTRIRAVAETLPIDLAVGWEEVSTRRAPIRPPEPLRPGGVASTHVRRHSYVSRPRMLLCVAAAVAVVAGVIGSLTLGTGPASGTPALPEPLPFSHGNHENAVALLEHAATLQRDSAGDGQVRYAKTQNYALQTDIADRVATTTIETTIREVWITSGSEVAKTAIQDTTRAGQPVGSPTGQTTDRNWHDINAQLPSSANEIAAALLGSDATGSDRDLILAQQIMAHLDQATTTPAQNSSMYSLLANLPGVFDAGTITDNAGRAGHAIGIVTGYFDAGSTCMPLAGSPTSINATLAASHALGNGITYLVLDPVTGNPLQIEQVDTPNAPCGLRLPPGPTIGQYSVILSSQS
jgi:hypothetical protein